MVKDDSKTQCNLNYTYHDFSLNLLLLAISTLEAYVTVLLPKDVKEFRIFVVDTESENGIDIC